MSKKEPIVALVAGGYSGEHVVSLRSQEGIRTALKGYPYRIYDVVITQEKWVALHEDEELAIDKNDFSFVLPTGEKVRFDYVYMIVHGTPGEDGKMTGYFDMLGLPYSCCPTVAGALTFDKDLTKVVAESRTDVAVPRGASGSGAEDALALAEEVCNRFPEVETFFVKPNAGGSSLGVSKVSTLEDLHQAIIEARKEDPYVIIEEEIVGTEVTCGVYEDATGVHVLPVTEVVPKKEFFDYEAKYEGAVEEITPARISDEMTREIQRLTEQIYHAFGLRGISRVDYIIKEGTPYFLEINTIPGMTLTSFIPQQIEANGQVVGDVLSSIIDFHLDEARHG